jgi:hypothetical protein
LKEKGGKKLFSHLSVSLHLTQCAPCT